MARDRERRRDNERKTISEKRNQLKGADVSIKNNTLAKIVLKSIVFSNKLIKSLPLSRASVICCVNALYTSNILTSEEF